MVESLMQWRKVSYRCPQFCRPLWDAWCPLSAPFMSPFLSPPLLIVARGGHPFRPPSNSYRLHPWSWRQEQNRLSVVGFDAFSSSLSKAAMTKLSTADSDKLLLLLSVQHTAGAAATRACMPAPFNNPSTTQHAVANAQYRFNACEQIADALAAAAIAQPAAPPRSSPSKQAFPRLCDWSIAFAAPRFYEFSALVSNCFTC